VSPSEFQRFIDTFGPFDHILQNCHKFVTSGGFEKLSASEATSKLMSSPPGTYVVRLSDNVFAMTISYKTKTNEVKHRRIGNPLWSRTLHKTPSELEEEYKVSRGVRTITENAGFHPYFINILTYIAHHKEDFISPLNPPTAVETRDDHYE
jgi:hypothetical protein